MKAIDVMSKAKDYIGQGYFDAGLRVHHYIDALEALSIAGEREPAAVLSSFHFIREAIGQDNLLVWVKSAHPTEMRDALDHAIEIAKRLQ